MFKALRQANKSGPMRAFGGMLLAATMVILGLALVPTAASANTASATALCTTTLQEGSSGSCVTALQQRLNELGAGIAVDGSFGPGTKNAVLAFQGRSRIGFDGVVGPTTRNQLNNPGSVNLNRASPTTINNYIDSVFGTNAPTARKIAFCESSVRETALNYNTNGTSDIGVFQMNEVHAGGDLTGFRHDMLYYQTNVQRAKALFVSSGNSFQPWYSSQSCWG